MKGKILLIDDDEVMHQLSNRLLTDAGYEMISAYNGQSGLDRMRSDRPDLVLLDYLMPGMNGYEVYKKVTQDPLLASLPIIMLTAVNECPAKKNELFQMGLAAYLNKPFGHKELINVIDTVLFTNKIKVKNEGLHKAVQHAKDFLENLIHCSPDAIITTDMSGSVTSFSRAAEEIFGYSAETIMNTPIFDYLSPKAGKGNFIEKLLNQQSIRNYEIDFFAFSGEYIPISFSLSLIKDKHNENLGILFIGKDISELKELKKELLEKEKLSVLMETAVAINHEINNPLTPILGNIQLLLLSKEKIPTWIIEKLQIIEKNAWRIQHIVQKLNRITQPVKKTYYGNTNMLDINQS
ncbi:response regulator [candidate division KSB1 bacterium]|nr:response regulator [candidate division KSB1 bacterium]